MDEVLKGTVEGSQVELVQWGGKIGGVRMEVAGGPQYAVGQRYLVFLTTDKRGAWTTRHLTLGRFEFRSGRVVRDRDEIVGWDTQGHVAVEVDRRADEFLEYIRARVRGVDAAAAYFVTDGDRSEGGTELRDQPAATAVSGYSFSGAAGTGASAWAGSGVAIGYSISGSPASGNTKNLGDGEERIIEEDPNGDIFESFTGNGVVATAFMRFSGPDHMFEGLSYNTLSSSDVVTQDGFKASNFTQSTFRSVMVHELGHTLGFRHSNQNCTAAVPCTSDAIMNSSVGATNGVLRPWDTDAVAAVYGSGGVASDYISGGRRTSTGVAFRLAELTAPACTAASIGTQPQSKSVAVGTTTSLTVVAGGTSPFTYQWFIGSSGDTSAPASGASATTSTLSVTPSSAGVTSFWVRVSNSCGTPVNSNSVTVTATCAAPAISSVSPNVSISEGNSTQLSVAATGSGLSYQWFVGTSGDTSSPITNATASTRTVSPATTTSYWVRVNGSCPGGPVNSNTVTVTVTACATLTVGAPIATPGPAAGNYTLSLNASSASGPVTIAWFRGGTPGSGGTQIGTGATLNTTVTLDMGPTLFWARVTNGCGRVAITSGITLAACTLPTITTQPEDRTINPNEAAPLTIVASAGTTVTWFRGQVGVTTDAILTGASVNSPPLAVTTQFWAQVTNSCGSVFSRQVTITVRTVAELVPMLNGRFFVQVRFINQFDGGLGSSVKCNADVGHCTGVWIMRRRTDGGWRCDANGDRTR